MVEIRSLNRGGMEEEIIGGLNAENRLATDRIPIVPALVATSGS
jgi:hypothetical protein